MVGGSNPSRLIEPEIGGLSSVSGRFSVSQDSVSRVQFLPIEEISRIKEVISSRFFLNSLAKHDIIEIIGLLSQERKRRYRRRKDRKYGNINKGFTEEELQKFFACCKHPKAHLAFRMQAYLGLRIGEVVKVKLEDIDFVKRKLKIQTEKAHTGDSLYLHEEIADKLKSWIDQHYDKIIKSEGYILFSGSQYRTTPHLNSNWLRAKFREVAIISGLNEWYAKADSTDCDKRQRKLYRLTTHSLRHYFITKVYKATKDPVVASKLARHTDMKSTQVYIHSSQRDLDVSMSNVFEQGELEKRKEQEDLKKLIEVWRLIK